MNKPQALYEQYDAISNMGMLPKETPLHIRENINPKFELRPYQVEALARFFHYTEQNPNRKLPVHLLFQMATGSGKTLLMAALILHLYKKGYRNFLFFVNRTTIIDKTKDNFLEKSSSKYLFAPKIGIDGKVVNINAVDHFDRTEGEDVNIHFTTIQGLHSTIHSEKEDSLTAEDFQHSKVVFLADEAHHINAATRKGEKDQLELVSWENTVMDLFEKNRENYLLEFTATIDTKGDVAEKYRDKKIYQYDLKQFRNDLYSKEVDILQSDADLKTRILQAVVMNYYRELIAQEHGVNLKSVVLFKSQKIADSKQNHEEFIEDVQKLEAKQLEMIRDKTNLDVLKKIFAYFEEKKISLDFVCEGIKRNFAKEKTLNVNVDKDVEEHQRKLNSLEDKNNEIRAIFAVDKLNEGWDVLNLFDIVRMYEPRQSGHNKLSPATISEAQLIGRGARYFPFAYGENNERFQRKYDSDQDHPLRILEELYYHSHNDSRYISEIKEALRETGLIDGDESKQVEIRLKEEVLKSNFYHTGKVFKNERRSKVFDASKEEHENALESLLREVPVEVELDSGKGKKIDALSAKEGNLYVSKTTKDFYVRDMERHLVKNALAKDKWFTFERIKRHFPNVQSIDDFIDNEGFLGRAKIVFRQVREETLSNEDKLKGLFLLLDKVKSFIENTNEQFEGTRFELRFAHEIFKESKKFKTKENKKSLVDYLADKDWYIYDKLYGTSEEESLVRLIERLHDELKSKYKEIYLVRNERMLDIYDKDGRRFEPDFVLFGIGFDGRETHYQCFLEPKGEQLQFFDKWKEDFLKEMQDGFAQPVVLGGDTHVLTAAPFYNHKTERDTEEEIRKAMRLE